MIHEGQTKYATSHCMLGVECSGHQYPAHWPHVIPSLSWHPEHGVFQIFSFSRLVRKHTARIGGYQDERQFFLKFFDIKAFIIMAVMMAGGIGLRASGIAPERFIAVFYTGLGAALLLAGLLFGHNFGKAVQAK